MNPVRVLKYRNAFAIIPNYSVFPEIMFRNHTIRWLGTSRKIPQPDGSSFRVFLQLKKEQPEESNNTIYDLSLIHI